jgi:murein L,D-transpeptidase YcbB/YkuD
MGSGRAAAYRPPVSRMAWAAVVGVCGMSVAWLGFRRQDPPRAPTEGSRSLPADTAPAARAAEAPADPAVAAAVGTILESGRHPWMRWPVLSDVVADLRAVYAQETDGLFWFAGDRADPAAPGAIEALGAAADRGLDPADYDAARIAAEWGRVREAGGSERAELDLALTAGVLREIRAAHHGRVDPRTLGWGFGAAVEARRLDGPAVLRDARARGVGAVLDGLEPAFPHYRRNKRELAHYRALARAGEPPAVPPLPKGRRKVAPGGSWDGLPAVRARLRALGDLGEAPPAAPADAAVYDQTTVEAVKRFQERHLLDADGVLGAGTLDAVNVPLARRVRQLELAMERGRWLPPLSDRPTVFVNVPLFRMWAADPARGDEPLRMRVVVGKSLDHRTPIFLEEMEYVVFRPYWNPPPSILRAEIVPHARRDPSYLAHEDLEIVASGRDDAPSLPGTPANLDAVLAGRLFLRQRPGPRNSLGLAKFIFPNHENVYMHGTPATQLFSRARRDFSHGCIRVEDPAAFAEWVLRDKPGWTRDKIEQAMQGTRPTQVNLPARLRVVIFYDTVHVNSEGVVHFVGDIYGHERALDEALARGYPYPEAEG